MYPELFTIPIFDWPVKSYGAMLTLGFLSGVWLAMRRAERVKTDPDILLNLGFVCLVCGVVGARLFFVVHYWESSFAKESRPWVAALDCTGGGLEYYGGLICAIVGAAIYLYLKRASIRLCLDILAPSAAWGLAFGRVGCLLNGCCWGGLAIDAQGNAVVPWGIRFPHASWAQTRQWENRQLNMPAELIVSDPAIYPEPIPLPASYIDMSVEDREGPAKRVRDLEHRINELEALSAEKAEIDELRRQHDDAVERLSNHRGRLTPLTRALQFPSRSDPKRTMTVSELEDLAQQCRSLPVHPAQVYGIINALLLSWVLSQLFHQRKRHGVVFATLCIVYPITRVLLELVRVDNRHDVVGMTISQAVSLGVFFFGVVLLLYLYKLPVRSPKVVAWIPPAEDQTKK